MSAAGFATWAKLVATHALLPLQPVLLEAGAPAISSGEFRPAIRDGTLVSRSRTNQTAKSSILAPASSAALSHLGFNPRPLQVAPVSLTRYLAATLVASPDLPTLGPRFVVRSAMVNPCRPSSLSPAGLLGRVRPLGFPRSGRPGLNVGL